MDETLQVRSHKLQARRQEVLLEIASLKRQREMRTDLLKPQQIKAFSTALRSKILDRSSRFGKDYLKLLVNEIKIEGNEGVFQAVTTGLHTLLQKQKRALRKECPLLY